VAGKRVILIGGGFGGLNAGKVLCRARNVEVLILDRRNHHLFQPLLYQVAMAGLSPAEISIPIRSVFRDYKNVQVLLAAVEHVDVQYQKVLTDIGEFSYDYLILACGSEHSYFGHDEWEDHAPGLKTLEQATEIRRRVLTAFEKAEAMPRDEQKKWLTFVLVGGGPTGVELAGALGEIARFTLAKDFRHINPSVTRVILIEAGPRLLAAFHEDLAYKAQCDLESLGVQIWTNCRVSEVTGEGVRIGKQEFVEAKTVIWAAGVKPSALNSQLGTDLDKQGRVIVSRDLSLPQHKNVFVIGDQAAFKTADGGYLPGLAPVAIQQGRFVAQQILRDLHGNLQRQDFRYKDKGQMATIGRKNAVVEINNLRFDGFFAWWMWLLIHIYYLIGFKNRFFVICEWAFSYLTYRRGARLITRQDWHSVKR
jgi:NADH dehydrogenase